MSLKVYSDKEARHVASRLASSFPFPPIYKLTTLYFSLNRGGTYTDRRRKGIKQKGRQSFNLVSDGVLSYVVSHNGFFV